jgi:pimeloyl-ACP methyl ester carboxylesterase
MTRVLVRTNDGVATVARPVAIELEVPITLSRAPEIVHAMRVTVYVPAELSPAPTVVFLYPGAGYNRSYYDLHIGGTDSYSQARFHAANGRIVVACDHLSIGQSSVPDDVDLLTVDDLAEANHLTASAVFEWLGESASQLGGKIVPATAIGMGQSFGGYILTVQQGQFKTFDAVALLGWTNIQCSIPNPIDGGRIYVSGAERGAPPVEPVGDPRTPKPHQPQTWAYWQEWKHCFHYDDVPEWIIAADFGTPDRDLSDVGIAYWRSTTTPACAAECTAPGPAAHEAAQIDTPVLIAAGERDVLPDLTREPAVYRSAPAVTVEEIPAMGHMHNFASTRTDLWNRLERWVRDVESRSDVPAADTAGTPS